MKIEMWADYTCPYCYMGQASLDQALDGLALNEEIEIVHKSFQLEPNEACHAGEDLNDLVAKRYGKSYEWGKAHNEQHTEMDAGFGLQLNLAAQTINNTILAHQATKFADAEGKKELMIERIYQATFEEGKDIGDKQTLLDLAGEIGLDAYKLAKAFEEKTYLNAAHSDITEAVTKGINGIPFYLINGNIPVYGLHKVDALKAILQQASEQS